MTRIPQAVGDYDLAPGKQWRLGETPWRQGKFPSPRARVIIDNDFSGDPDDLYQIVHHLLSPSVEIRAVIGSHLRPDDPFDPGEGSAANATKIVHDVFARMGLQSTELIFEGAARAIPDTATPVDSPAARAIIAEALRTDVNTPLYVAVGGGLTDLASALLLEPSIASRITLVWIGGSEHDGLAFPPPDGMPVEYNLLIDIAAGQVVFGCHELEIWQVPRNVYRQCLVSDVELRRRVAALGPLGQYLFDEVQLVMDRTVDEGRGPAETYALGDSPLVLLTALQSVFEADTTSSFHVERPTPQLTAEGAYRPVRGSRQMRIYTQVDVRLMFEDMFLKLDEFCRWQADS